jgi:hypothetical protein
MKLETVGSEDNGIVGYRYTYTVTLFDCSFRAFCATKNYNK